MKKNVTIYSVLGVSVERITESLMNVRGLQYGKPRINRNGFCEVELVNVTNKQWQSLMRMW